MRVSFPPFLLVAAALIAGLAPGLSGCASTPPARTAEVPTPAAAPVITFVDLDGFDRSLEQALGSGAAEVAVVFVAPMSPNAIAPRLGRWLNTVQEAGGEVVFTNDPNTRSFSLISGLLEAVHSAWREMRIRSLVKDIKVEVLVSSNEIKRVVFRRK